MNPMQEQAHAEGADRPLGLRMREAREARNMGVIEAGERLKVPAVVVEAMEREDFDRLGAPVYVRGHLAAYARLLGLPASLVDAALAARADLAPPELHVTTRTPRGHVLFDRYARRAVYLALTGAIVLPVIWLATQNSLPAQRALLAPPERAEATGAPGSTQAERERPVMATLAPFYREEPALPPAAPSPDVAALEAQQAQGEELAPGASGEIAFAFKGASWVEILSTDGGRLAYGLIEPGRLLSFPATRVASVALGDASAVEVTLDGQSLDLEPFQRAKVARFALSSDGEAEPVGG